MDTIVSHPISHEQHGAKGAFVIDRQGQRLAEMTYSRAGEQLIIIDHTDVSDVLRGTGSGKRLVEQAVEWAREQQMQIIPLCPFARSVFDKMPEWQDVLKK